MQFVQGVPSPRSMTAGIRSYWHLVLQKQQPLIPEKIHCESLQILLEIESFNKGTKPDVEAHLFHVSLYVYSLRCSFYF